MHPAHEIPSPIFDKTREYDMKLECQGLKVHIKFELTQIYPFDKQVNQSLTCKTCLNLFNSFN